MNSQKNKADILPLSRSKNKKYAKACKKGQCYEPTSKCDAGIQNCAIKGDMTTDSILSSISHKAIRKRKANGNITPRKTKTRRIKCKSTIIQEPGAVSSLLDRVSDSGSIDTSETESYLPVKMSPSNTRTIKKNSTSELCNENILSVSDSKLCQLSLSVQPKSPVVRIPLISKIPNSDMSVISSENNLDIKETSMPYSTSTLENDLSEIGINDVILRSSTSFENINPIVESSRTDFELFLHSSTNDNEQNIVKTSLDNNINPIYDDIIALLVSRLNEVKDSKENFICNQLKIKPIIKHEKFNYDECNAFNLACDVSTLKAANDYIKEMSSGSDDIPLLPSDVIMENSDTLQNSLVELSGFTPDLVNFITGASNELNLEKVKSAICVNSYNDKLSHDLDNCSQGNLYNVENSILSQDLNVDSYEINNENLCEGVNLLTEDNIEKSDKLCATVKRRKKRVNWNNRKRGRENKSSSLPKVNGLLNEIPYCDETEISKNVHKVSANANELVDLNSASSPQSLTKKTKLNTMIENTGNENHNTSKAKDQKITCMIKAKCIDASKNTKSNLEYISENPAEDEDKCNETEQCSKDQAKHYLLENSINTGACDEISCYNSSQLSIDCDTSYSVEKCINPNLLSQKSDNLEINKTNLRTKCNISYAAEKNTANLGLTAEGKEFKLLEGLIVGLEKLDEHTLSKYCAASNIQDNYPTQHEKNQIAVDVGTTELSYSNSDNTLVSSCSDGLAKEAELHSSKDACKKKKLDLEEHLRSPKKSKPLPKSKREKNRYTDLEVCEISKQELKIKLRIKNAPKKLDNSLTGSEKNTLEEALTSKNEGEAICDIEINNNSEKQFKATDSSHTKVLSSNKKLNAESEQKLSNESVSISEEINLTGDSQLNKLPEEHSKSDDISNTAITVCGYESSNVTDTQTIACLKSNKKEKCTSDLVLNKRTKRNLKTDSANKSTPLHEKKQMISPKHNLQHPEVDDHAENPLKNNSQPKTVSPEEQVSVEKNVSGLESNADTSVSSDRESNIHEQNNMKTGCTPKKTVSALRKKTISTSSDTEILSPKKKLNTESEQKLCYETVNISKEKNVTSVPELDKHFERHSKSDDLSDTAITVCGYESSNVTDKQTTTCLKSNKKEKCTSDLVLNKRPKRNVKTDSAIKSTPLHEKNQMISPKHNLQHPEVNDHAENPLQNNSQPKTVSPEEQFDLQVSVEKNVSVLESNADTSVSFDRESFIHEQNNKKTGRTSKKNVASLQKKTAAISSDREILPSNKKLNNEYEQKLSNETENVSKEKNVTGVSELNKVPEKHSKSDVLSNAAIILCENESSSVTDKQNVVCLKSKKKEKSTSDLVLNKHPKRNLKTDSANKSIPLHEKDKKMSSPKHKVQHEGVDDHAENPLQNNCQPKTVSPEEPVDQQVSVEKNVSVLESNADTSVSSDRESNIHEQNNIKTGCTTKKTVTTLKEKLVVLSDKKAQSFDDCLAYTVVNENKKNKNNNVCPKKSKEVKSSKCVGNENKIKVSRSQMIESAKSLTDSVTFSDIDKKKSNCKIKGSDRINRSVQNPVEKSINKLDSRITSPKSCNSVSISQDLDEKNVDMCITDSDLSNENIIEVKSMASIPECSYKKKTEKAASDINHNKDLKEPLFKSPYAKLIVTNNSKAQCSTSQISYFEDNFNDALSTKSVGKTSTVILMNDDCLDYEPDQPDHNESSCMTDEIDDFITADIDDAPLSEPDWASNSLEITEFEESEYSITLKDNTIKEPDSILLRNHTSLTDSYNRSFGYNSAFADEDLINEEDTDSEDEHSFKRIRYERKDNNGNETSLNYVDLKSWKESDAVQNEVLQKESEQGAVNSSVSSLESESLKSSCEDQVLNNDQINSLKSKEPAGSVAHLTDVLSQIQDLCFKGLFDEVLKIVKTYCAISSSDINQYILQNLLVSTFSFISRLDKMDNSFVTVFDEILKLMCDFNICNKKIASYFITKCCLYPDLNIYSMKLFHMCHKSNIPLDTKAVKALSLLFSVPSLSLSEEIPFDLMLDFMNYTKLICKKNIYKELLHLALKKCEIPDLSFSDIHHVCSLLHGITSKEVEEQNLKDFILLIFKKNMWQHVAEMFIAWGTKNCLSVCIYTALTTDYKTMGKYFKKFASYVHEKEGSLCPELKGSLTPEMEARFGQMGTALMLNAFSKNAMDIALDILYILHTYNVNYFELQLSMSSSLLTQSNLEAESYSFKIFPFSVVFTAIDICLHFDRPIDAFTIFQGYSWVVPDESLDEAVKTYVIKGKCQRLLKLVSLLNNEDLLDKGFESLQNLLTLVKQDFAYEILKENVCDLVSIYNEYLVSLMNAERLSSVYILYEYSLGPQKDIFTIFPDVLRGLVVTFSEDGRDSVANTLLLLGIMKKIYPLQKPKLEHFPWEITLVTHWTVTEVKLAVQWFIEDLFSVLMQKPAETHFENWFSVKIVFDIKDLSSEGLNCLKETISEPKYYITKTKTALENMDPSLEVTEDINENVLFIKSNSLYNFWKSRCPDQVLKFIDVDMQFLRVNDTFSFGSKRKHSKERESSIFVKTFLNETCSSSKSSDKMIEPQNLIQSLQSPSPSNWKNPSATAVYEMIHEIKANTPPFVATTPEHSPSGQNSLHNIPQSERFCLSDPMFNRTEQIDEFQYPPHSPAVSPSQLTEDNFTFTSKIQQATFLDINQSKTNNDTTNNSSHFQTPFSPCSSSSNISPQTSNAICNSPQSDFRNKELLPKNSSEKSGSSSSKISILKTSVTTSEPLVSSKKVSLLRSRTISLNKTPVKVNKINTPVRAKKITIKKGKILKTNNSSKKFQNFKVCITPGDRTVSSPSIQSSSVEIQSVKSNLESSIITNIQENRRLSFNEEMSVSNASCNRTSPVVSKTAYSDAKTVTINFTDAGSGTLMSRKVSDSDVTLVKLPVSKVKGPKQKLDELPVSSQTTLKSTKSPIQSVTSSPKGKFVKTVNLKNISNDKSSNVSINTSLQNIKRDQPKPKPVINRNSYYSSISKTSTSVTSNAKIASVASGSGETVMANDGNEKTAGKKQNFVGNELFTNCTPVIGRLTWNEEESKKVTQFLKAKVAFKHKDLSPIDQNKKVHSLFQAFIESNEGITKLDKRTMKLLMEFADDHV